MLYYLHLVAENFATSDNEFFKAFNVFRYVTFRALMAAITSFIICLLFGNYVIRRLISLKFGQPIRTAEEVHKLFELHGAKKGTPTMGGILLLASVGVAGILWARPTNPFVWLVLVAMLFHGAVGFMDDWLKVTRKNSDGISSRLKFSLQCILALGITVFLVADPFGYGFSEQVNGLYAPFFKDPIIPDMGWFSFVFYLLVIVGASNAVNLTDGLDGLAAGCTVTAAASYAVLTYVAGHLATATYLQIPHFSHAAELPVLCMALAGAGLGFLWWNCHPARVFMGDTGSLAIGGMLGVVAICCKQELLLVVVGGVFVAEALSVILQVGSYKLTGKRIFKMSPLHHHFELSGWKESTVIVRFWIMAILFAMLGLATLKLR